MNKKRRFNIHEYNKSTHLENEIKGIISPVNNFFSACDLFYRHIETEFSKKAETKEGQELVDNELLAIWGQTKNVSILFGAN